MRYLPMFLDLDGREVLIAGGAGAAVQKLRLVARTGAAITVMAPEVAPGIAEAVAAGRAAHVAAELDTAALAGAALVFVCTGSAVLDARVAAAARAAGALVNVVDRPELCDAITPAIVDRDPLVVAIGTEGAAPVLAREVRGALETMLEPGLGRLAALAGGMRPLVAENIPPEGRRRFWEWVFRGPPRRLFREGREHAAAKAIADAARGGTVPGAGGALTIIALPEASDLLTLRALQRLQEADLILHGEPAPETVLDLARRDAARGPLEARRAAEAVTSGARVVALTGESDAAFSGLPDAERL